MIDPLLIFDCDGVLVDSEPITFELLIDHCAASGFEISETEAYEAFLGKPVADLQSVVRDTFKREIEPIDLLDFQIRLRNEYQKDLRPVAGVAEALASINLPMCVASSSNMARIQMSLTLTRLDGFFGKNFFSTDLVARGKPHPDVFLYAANSMKFSPEKAIVIEDSPAGIRAAKAAGMAVIGFYGASHGGPAKLKDRLAALQPDLLIDDLGQLKASIEVLLANAALRNRRNGKIISAGTDAQL